MERAQRRKYHYIYKTTCIITNRFYIGMHSTDNLEDGYIGSGKRLWYSINKHGKDNHVCEILEFLPDRSSLKAKEKEIVNEELICDKMCMNLSLGGGGGHGSTFLTKEQLQLGRKNADKVLLEKYGPGWRKLLIKFTPESRKKAAATIKKGVESGEINYAFTGKKHSKETKNKMSKSSKGQGIGSKNSQYNTCWIYNINFKENKKIKQKELQIYLSQGWLKGRKMKF